MSELEIMTFKGVRGYVDADGVAQLNLEDVARGLGFTQEKNGVEYVKWERVESYLAEIGFPHKWGKGDFIPENIFYRLAMKAKNAVAEAFQAKIADEVIPSIRKHGLYATESTVEAMLNDPDTAIRLLQEIKEERERRKALEAENSALAVENALQKQAIADFQPVQQYVDTILSSTRTLTITQIAADYDMSAKKLNRILHEEGVQRYVNGQWILYKQHMGKGYTKSKTINITRSDGQPDTVLNTEWTQKGRLMIHEILTARGIQAVMDKQAA